MHYLQSKYNISRHFLKTSLRYRVEHKSFKMLQLLYQAWWQSCAELLW